MNPITVVPVLYIKLQAAEMTYFRTWSFLRRMFRLLSSLAALKIHPFGKPLSMQDIWQPVDGKFRPC
jgi:hypothetical protein